MTTISVQWGSRLNEKKVAEANGGHLFHLLSSSPQHTMFVLQLPTPDSFSSFLSFFAVFFSQEFPLSDRQPTTSLHKLLDFQTVVQRSTGLSTQVVSVMYLKLWSNSVMPSVSQVLIISASCHIIHLEKELNQLVFFPLPIQISIFSALINTIVSSWQQQQL